MADLKSATLKNVELRWACLAEPMTRGEFASNKYQVDVVMDKDTAKIVKELKNPRQQIKELDDGLYSITLKSTKQPNVLDARKVKLSEEDMKRIGNGTKANVRVNQYLGFKDQTFLGLKAVMITGLQEYAGADDFADIEVDADESTPFDTGDDDDLI